MNAIKTIRKNLLIFAFVFSGTFPLLGGLVSNVTISSRWPWEGKVDINYTIGGKEDVPYKVAFYGMGDDDMEFALTTLSGDGVEGTVPGSGTYRATWDAKADLPEASYKAFKVKVKAESAVKPRIRVSVGERSFEADLHDNAAAEAFWDKLPLTLPMMNLYGREMCNRMGKGALPDDTAADLPYEVGDISYWPPMGSLVILYKQNGEVFEQMPIGHTNADISFFDGMGTTNVLFEQVVDIDKGTPIYLSIGGKRFAALVDDSETGREFLEKLPLTLSMSELNGNEKYCYGVSLPSAPEYYDKIEPGELMLYGSNCIVLFYGKAGGYSYTRIGKLTSAEGLAEAVGSGAVSVTFDKAKAAEESKEKNK